MTEDIKENMHVCVLSKTLKTLNEVLRFRIVLKDNFKLVPTQCVALYEDRDSSVLGIYKINMNISMYAVGQLNL